MKYKHIFWDWNGTLIDDVGNALACVNDMLARKKREPITLDEYYTYVETPIVGFYRHILPPEELDFDEISKNYHLDYIRHLPETKLACGCKEVLSKLKEAGAKQYIVTATHIDEATELVKRYGVAEYFDAILGAQDNLAESKIERAVAFFEENGINPDEAVFVGDTLHDLETANAMGIACILVEYGHQGRRLLSGCGAYVADTLETVCSMISDAKPIDLHAHSNCSDGSLSPSEFVVHAKECGLAAVALTDHDGIDGIDEALAKAEEVGIELIPGIEFSVVADTEIHMVGLFIDHKNETLVNLVNRIKEQRTERMKDICARLQALGFDVTFEDAKRLTAKDDYVGRPHIAAVLLEKGYTSYYKEAFEKYIGHGKPAYSPRTAPTAAEAIGAINAAGGLAFWAHLNQTGYPDEVIREKLKEFKSYGLYGIEGYYSEYTPDMIRRYRALATEAHLAFSGGSDFHGDAKKGLEMGTGYGELCIPCHVLANLKAAKKQKSGE